MQSDRAAPAPSLTSRPSHHRRGGLRPSLPQRIGYSMGIASAPDWARVACSASSPASTADRAGMVFHLPATCVRYGAWTVGASETVIVTKHGAEPLSDLPRALTLRVRPPDTC